MKKHRDIFKMSNEELQEYLDDVATGYAFDPDNEILDNDKNLSVRDLFEQLKADVNSLRFKSINDYAAVMSRTTRICNWMYEQVDVISRRLSTEFAHKIMKEEHRIGKGNS